MINLPIHSLNNKLISLLNKDMAIGLSDGKAGFCIYFHYIALKYNDDKYKKIANILLDEVFNDIDTIDSLDVKNGFAGIGLCVNYLIKNKYVTGNINAILHDLDDVVFKRLSYFKYKQEIDLLSSIHILYYLCIRLKDQRKGSENEYLFKELIIQTVNNLYENLPSNFQEEPLSYSIEYLLPQLLFILSEIHQLNFYNHRLTKIIEELSYKVLSTLPLLHSNKLYLLWAMNTLNKQIQNKSWDDHMIILRENLNIDHILNCELRNKNIFFDDGVTSIYLLVKNMPNYFSLKEQELIKKNIINKIYSSEVWELLENNKYYFKRYSGLYNGFTGVSLLLHTLTD